MNTITFPGLLIEQAKEILSAAYKYDKASTFVNDLCVTGSCLTAVAVKNDKKSSTNAFTWWDVKISSDVLSEASLKEVFSEQLYMFC